ncbi:hypothetical protein BGW37DRAFT_520212 [Umbelopsis sp. PMI_123]|nr:hypothetical protein BGW37DRAFT_520212 [Umbelopsis sp. PMI_123]
MSSLKKNLRTYSKNLLKYEGGAWTLSGAVNKELLASIKKYKMDVLSIVEAFHKGLIACAQQREPQSKSTKICGKKLDKDAKTLAIKAANLPESVRHIADEDEDENDLCVTTKTIEKINKARFEEDILRRTTYEEFRRGSTGGRVEATVVEVISIEEPTQKSNKDPVIPSTLKEIYDLHPVLENVYAWGKTADLLLPQLQKKTLILLTIATMWWPRSHLGTIQLADVTFTSHERTPRL